MSRYRGDGSSGPPSPTVTARDLDGPQERLEWPDKDKPKRSWSEYSDEEDDGSERSDGAGGPGSPSMRGDLDDFPLSNIEYDLEERLGSWAAYVPSPCLPCIRQFKLIYLGSSFLHMLPWLLALFMLTACIPLLILHSKEYHPSGHGADGELGVMAELGQPLATQTYGECDCRPGTWETNVLIILSKPWRYFASAHWFHICEYYLPHFKDVKRELHTNATIFIKAPTTVFLQQLTKMTFFLLMLAFTDGAPARVEILPPHGVLLRSPSLAYIYSVPESYIFDTSLPVLHRFDRSNGSGFPVPTLLPNGSKPSTVSGCTCARVIGEFGGAPIERGYWFGSEAAVNATRDRIHKLCARHPSRAHAKESWTGLGESAIREEPVLGAGGYMGQLSSKLAGIKERLGGLWRGSRGSDGTTPTPGTLSPPLTADMLSSSQTTGLYRKKAKRRQLWSRMLGLDGGSSGRTSRTRQGGSGRHSARRGTRKDDQRRRLVIYQRNRDRRLEKHEVVTKSLQRKLGNNWNISVIMHSETRHPCVIWSMLRSIDVLITPHGFQSILLIFMRRGSAIFEVNPSSPASMLMCTLHQIHYHAHGPLPRINAIHAHSHTPHGGLQVFPHKYWKDGYRPFANEYGLWHGWAQNRRATTWSRNFALSFISQEKCMLSLDCREYARQDNVYLDDTGIKVS